MSKTKTFVATISKQPEGKLDLLHYVPVGCKELDYGRTRFPIIPAIAHYGKGEESIKIIVVLIDNENCVNNYKKYFRPEVEQLCEELGVKPDIVEVGTPDNENIDTHIKLFVDLIGKIGGNEELYACTSYGTKPTPMVISLALNYAHRLIENTSVELIVYGLFNHGPKKEGSLYDVTPLFFMGSIVNKLAEMNAPNPEKTIRLLLGQDVADGTGSDERGE